jgi:hypothetical protein
VIDVVQEEIERRDALRQAALNRIPFTASNDARQQIVREDFFRAFFASVDREGDALIKKRQVGSLLAAAQFFGGQIEQALIERKLAGARRPFAVEHLVISGVEMIVRKRQRQS